MSNAVTGRPGPDPKIVNPTFVEPLLDLIKQGVPGYVAAESDEVTVTKSASPFERRSVVASLSWRTSSSGPSYQALSGPCTLQPSARFRNAE